MANKMIYTYAKTGLTTDALRTAFSPISLDGDMNNRKEFIKLRGLNSSYLEHKVIENLLMKGEAVSAVKALQTASQNGIPLYKIDSSNISTQLPLLTVSSIVKENIRNTVNAGKEVIVSRDNVTINSWAGVGYIMSDPVSGVGEYMISDAFNGGHWECPVSGNCNVYLDASMGAIAVIMSGERKKQESLRMTVGQNIQWYSVDFEVLSVLLAASLSKFNYTAKTALEASEQETKTLINQPHVWIIHYTGHGSDLIINGVRASRLKSDSKIIFLNSCRSGTAESIDAFAKGPVSSFTIDQTLKIGDGAGLPRKEIFLGWNGDVPITPTDDIAIRFWWQMGRGITVEEAIKNINHGAIGLTIESKDENGNTIYVPLIFEGVLGTTLEMWK